jgi:hypothetical protein
MKRFLCSVAISGRLGLVIIAEVRIECFKIRVDAVETFGDFPVMRRGM